MKKVIISDTTALIILAKTNHLELLTNLIDKVYVPTAVMEEIGYKNDEVKYIIEQAKFIEVKKITNQSILKEVKLSNLDRGEVEAISLALENDLSLIIDERLGRRYAESKGVKIIGLLGILKANLVKEYISYVDLLYILNEFKCVKFRISARLEENFLRSLSDYT
jgi:hypothetical protein